MTHSVAPKQKSLLNPFSSSFSSSFPTFLLLQALGVSSQNDRAAIKKKMKDLRKAQEKLEKQREKKEKEGRRSGRLPVGSSDSVC